MTIVITTPTGLLGVIAGNPYTASWVLSTSDLDEEAEYNSSSPGTATIPLNLSPQIGVVAVFSQTGTGALTLAGAAGVTFTPNSLLTTTGQSQTLFARQQALNVWRVTGSWESVGALTGTAGGFLAGTYPDPVAATDLSVWGIKADARLLSGASVSGTALTASTNQFVVGDVGRTVVLYKAAGAGVQGQAVVQTYNSPTSVTLATSITTISNTYGAIGTDDTVAWQTAINAGYATPGGMRITSDLPCISLIAGPQVTGTVANTNGNGSATYSYSGQLLLPANAIGNEMSVLKIQGPLGTGNPAGGGAGIYNYIDHVGLILLSTAASGNIIDVIPDPNGFSFGIGAFSYIRFDTEDVTFRTAPNAAGTGPGCLNLLAAACVDIKATCDVDWPFTATLMSAPPPSPGPTSNVGAAIVLPGAQNWGLVRFDGIVAYYSKGIVHTEHAEINARIQACGAALAPGTAAALNRTPGDHVNYYHKVIAQACGTVLEPLSKALVYGMIDIEVPGIATINDPHFYLSGDLTLNVGGVSGLGNYPSAWVGPCGNNLVLRTLQNPTPPSVLSPVVDSLQRSTAPHGIAFGLADGSNHVWYGGAPGTSAFLTDANGAYAPLNGAWCVQTVLNTPAYTSKKISATIKSSATASRTTIGLAFRAVNATEYLYLVLSNAAAPLGFTIGKNISGTLTAFVTNAAAVAANTSYQIDVYVRSSVQPNADMQVTLCVGGVQYAQYTLTAAEAAIFLGTGSDGLFAYSATASNDNGGSRITNFNVYPATDLPFVHAGTATLASGTIAVANTLVSANTKVRVWNDSASGTVGALSVVITPATGFTVNSSSGSDGSTVYYEIVSY